VRSILAFVANALDGRLERKHQQRRSNQFEQNQKPEGVPDGRPAAP
jgi:hypothetical protein